MTFGRSPPQNELSATQQDSFQQMTIYRMMIYIDRGRKNVKVLFKFLIQRFWFNFFINITNQIRRSQYPD